MTDDQLADTLLNLLAGLRPMEPRESHDRRVRHRCHEMLAERRSRRELRSGRLVDLMAAAAAGLYLAAVVTEAVRLWVQ
jgi:hypothetical protein